MLFCCQNFTDTKQNVSPNDLKFKKKAFYNNSEYSIIWFYITKQWKHMSRYITQITASRINAELIMVDYKNYRLITNYYCSD